PERYAQRIRRTRGWEEPRRGPVRLHGCAGRYRAATRLRWGWRGGIETRRRISASAPRARWFGAQRGTVGSASPCSVLVQPATRFSGFAIARHPAPAVLATGGREPATRRRDPGLAAKAPNLRPEPSASSARHAPI